MEDLSKVICQLCFKGRQCFSRPLFERNYMHGSISIENISFSRNCDIKITNAKSTTDASTWVIFISTNNRNNLSGNRKLPPIVGAKSNMSDYRRSPPIIIHPTPTPRHKFSRCPIFYLIFHNIHMTSV